MKWWLTAWQLAKDVLLTGTGLALIISQVSARQPSDVLLVTGLALTVPSVASHATALLSGKPSTGEHGPPGSSSSSPQHGSLPGSSQDGPGDPAD